LGINPLDFQQSCCPHPIILVYHINGGARIRFYSIWPAFNSFGDESELIQCPVTQFLAKNQKAELVTNCGTIVHDVQQENQDLIQRHFVVIIRTAKVIVKKEIWPLFKFHHFPNPNLSDESRFNNGTLV
jgi:hypothetical protein